MYDRRTKIEHQCTSAVAAAKREDINAKTSMSPSIGTAASATGAQARPQDPQLVMREIGLHLRSSLSHLFSRNESKMSVNS